MMAKERQFGPNQQSMTGVRFECGAEANEFLGSNNDATPHWHQCKCSPKHSSLPVCHRCACVQCARIRLAIATRISKAAASRRSGMKQLDLFA
jgi:hypothetical protein